MLAKTKSSRLKENEKITFLTGQTIIKHQHPLIENNNNNNSSVNVIAYSFGPNHTLVPTHKSTTTPTHPEAHKHTHTGNLQPDLHGERLLCNILLLTLSPVMFQVLVPCSLSPFLDFAILAYVWVCVCLRVCVFWGCGMACTSDLLPLRVLIWFNSLHGHGIETPRRRTKDTGRPSQLLVNHKNRDAPRCVCLFLWHANRGRNTKKEKHTHITHTPRARRLDGWEEKKLLGWA